MTELVTVNAAREAQQLALLAQRPDTAPRQNQQHAPIQVSHAGVQPDARRATAGAEAGAQDHAQQDLTKRGKGSDQSLTGPSRPRIEIVAFAAPNHVTAPTPDLVPSTPAPDTSIGLAPSNNLANSPVLDGQSQADVEVAIAQRALHTSINENISAVDPQARGLRLEAAARALRASSVIPVANFNGPQSPEVELQKFANKAAAAQGVASGQPVDEKFYGRGTEAVVGQFAAPDQTQKYADKAAATQPGTINEAGSGEVKFYDKVAQTEADFAGGQQQDPQKSYYERAQESATTTTDPTQAAPAPVAPTTTVTKTVTVQVTA